MSLDENTNYKKYEPNKKIYFFVIAIVSILSLILLIDFFIRKTIYLKNPEKGFLYTYASIRNIPAISIYGNNISYTDFENILNKNIYFYNKVYDIDKMPSDQYIKDTIERKLTVDTIIKNLSNTYNIKVTDREIYDETKKYIDEFGSEEKLNSNLNNYYGVNIQFFQDNYIKPYILKNKINVFIKTDEKINKDKYKKIKDIYNKIKDDNFLAIAKLYNNDSRLQESGGILDWIDQKTLQSDFPSIADSNIKTNYVSNILRNEDGYYIIKILDTQNEKVKIAMIKVKSMDLSEYLQKQYNNIKIREYIN